MPHNCKKTLPSTRAALVIRSSHQLALGSPPQVLQTAKILDIQLGLGSIGARVVVTSVCALQLTIGAPPRGSTAYYNSTEGTSLEARPSGHAYSFYRELA
eukprot:354900-Chlamydomonas_euryale.AAC.4